MRRMIPQKLIEFLKKLTSLIGFTGNKIEVGNDLEVDGKVILNEADDLVDKDGNPLITEGEIIVDSAEIVKEATPSGTKLYIAQTITNKINNSLQLPAQAPATHKLVGIDTAGGQELVDPPEGGKLYRHQITFRNDPILGSFDAQMIIYTKDSEPLTTITKLYSALNGKISYNKFPIHIVATGSAYSLPSNIVIGGHLHLYSASTFYIYYYQLTLNENALSLERHQSTAFTIASDSVSEI